MVWEGLGPGELYEPGEIRGFELSQGGQPIGHSWGRYVGPVGTGPTAGHRFETRTELLLPGRPPARAEGMLLLDEAGHLVEGYERSDAVALNFSRNGEVLAFTDGTRDDEVLYTPERNDTAFMAHSVFFHEELMLGLRRLEDGAMQWRVVSLSGGAPVEWEAQLVQAPIRTGGTAVLRTNLGEEITVEDGRMVGSRVAASGLTVRAMTSSVQWPTWSIAEPKSLAYTPSAAGAEVHELELPGRQGEPVLHGELLVPPGTTTPTAAVLWISSTGREDRYGFAGPPPVDLGSHEITDAIAAAGVVVLRFDERGRGRSEAGPMTFSAQLEDVRRAFRTLVVQPQVDPDRVIVVAHGEGGLRALGLVAQQGAGVAGLALLASPGRPYLEVLRGQGREALSQVPPQLREKARVQQEKMLEDLREGTVPPELADHAGWLSEVLELDPARMMARAQGPVWLAQGDKDFEVDPQADPQALLAAAKARGKRWRATLVHYPTLDHLFKPEPGRSTPSRYREPGRSVDTAFVADLTDWILEATKPAARGRGRKR